VKIKVSVEECAQRRDGLWLISYRANGWMHIATSKEPQPVGRDVFVEDGKVVG
jgi:hypothetical protein